MRTRFKELLRPFVPQVLRQAYQRMALIQEARRLSRLEATADTPALVAAAWCFGRFRPIQRPREIARLLSLLSEPRPTRICEIGSAGGGTTLLFSRVAATDARIVSIDGAFTEARRRAIQAFALPRQTLVGLARDSHREETVAEVRELLHGPLDFLFIDGDHSYDGVTRDFALYRGLVRPSGLIAFHDIVPDHRTRFGIDTAHVTGGVPRLWAELKGRHLCEEIVDDPAQDGYGIGVVRWQG